MTIPNSLVLGLAEARLRYQEDARTNHITLDKPQYTNAPWSEIRLRAAALKGDGLAASLCSGSNDSQRLFWLLLAATNGWIPSQAQLAEYYEYEPATNTYPDIFHEDEHLAAPLRVILKQPREARLAAARFWWGEAKDGVPKLNDDVAHGKARAFYELGLLLQSGHLVESNYTVGWQMFHKAAELGLVPAQAKWGSYCEWQTNHIEAAGWYYRAATQGLALAQSYLCSLHCEPFALEGFTHFDPKFQPSACEMARWTFERACQPVACFTAYFGCVEMGKLYLSGLGVESNTVEAVKWYHRAIDLGDPCGDAEYQLALCCFGGDGVPQDDAEGLKWIQKAKEKGYKVDDTLAIHRDKVLADDALRRGDFQTAIRFIRKNAVVGDSTAQAYLGTAFRDGKGVERDGYAASQWFQKAAEQGHRVAQFELGLAYAEGSGVVQDYPAALKWYTKAADQGHVGSQNNLGVMYQNGYGVPQDYVEAYKWFNLAAAQGDDLAVKNRDQIVLFMAPSQIAEGQRLARDFKPTKPPASASSVSPRGVVDSAPATTGTGFFITENGFLVSNAHVVEDAAQLRLVTRAGLIPVRVVKLDDANDLALLKAEGRFTALPLVASRSMRLGATVATVGFPNIGLQGFAPKLAKGEIAALSGAQDDPRYFQISVPLQPGNSGGALVDDRGNVVGVVSAKLNAAAALTTSGALPENVNYAVKSSFLLGFLESVPEVSAKLKEPETKDRKFEDVVNSAEKAAVLVLVY